LEECCVFFFESVECSLAKICPFLGWVRAQREHAYTRRDVSSSANLATKLEQRLFQFLYLFSVVFLCFFLVIQSLYSRRQLLESGKREDGR
jgi:hypothetical protein